MAGCAKNGENMKTSTHSQPSEVKDALEYTPLVSVLMPAYNHERFVEEAIRSVWSQTYQNIELIVVDDASTDGSRDLIQRLKDQSPISMQTTFKRKNAGISHSLNMAASLARGGWVAFLSSDDFFETDKIEKQMEVVKRLGSEFGCIHSDGWAINETGKVLYRSYSRSSIPPLQGTVFDDLVFNRARIIATTALVRRDLIGKVGGFDENLVAEDYDFYLRLARLTHFHYHDEPLVYVRISGSSLGRQPWLWGDSVFAALSKHADVEGYDWPRVTAERWFTLLPVYYERGSIGVILSATEQSAKAAYQANIFWIYVIKVCTIALRSLVVRIKRAVWYTK